MWSLCYGVLDVTIAASFLCPTVRTVLLALIGFMPTEGVGAVGSMDCSAEERKRLARKSLEWRCSVCGVLNADLLAPAEEGGGDQAARTMAEAADIVTQMAFKVWWCALIRVVHCF